MAQRRGRGTGADPRARHAGRPATDTVGNAAPHRDLAAMRAAVRGVVEPVIAAAGYDLDGLTLSRAGRRYLLRITVDGEAGVHLDAIAELSRLLSDALDAAEHRGGELIAGEYQLEVSSPGVDRPLTLPRHWRRNVGRVVQVRANQRQLTGRLLAADADGVVLDLDGTAHRLHFDELGPGRVQLEFARLATMPDGDDPGDEGEDEE